MLFKAVHSPIKRVLPPFSSPRVALQYDMHFSKFLLFLAALVPLASAIQFTIPNDLQIHTCPGKHTKITWDYVDTDPEYANIYESAQNGNPDYVKLLAQHVKISRRHYWITNSELIKAVPPATGVRFRLGLTKEQIFAESVLVDVVCP
jgi:hypothetical protein